MAQLKQWLIRRRWLLFLWLSAHFVLSCSSSNQTRIQPLADSQGQVFFSMTVSGYPAFEFKLTFVNELTSQEITAELRNNDSEIDSGQESADGFRSFLTPKGKLIELALPAGVYRLKQWTAKPDTPLGEYSLAKDLNKRFRVKAGHELYLGNLHLHLRQKTQSLFIRDNRLRDVSLFYQRHDRLKEGSLLISSAVFLNPAANRAHLFNAYAGCSPSGYQLYSKKRLPLSAEKFRTLRLATEHKKVSRIDGYRLKFRDPNGYETLNLAAELSDARHYQQDKEHIRQWFVGIKAGGVFNSEFEKKPYFSEYSLISRVLVEQRLLYKAVMFDDAAQMIVTLAFTNPPDYQRFYQTAEGFLPAAQKAVDSYQQCVEQRLNHS
ncbi:MAG: hypothetical protein OEY36_11065 [Gammaproteobacteria bacterium]|nr:hypothetical protein [Gammaproteobacteria bacterium]